MLFFFTLWLRLIVLLAADLLYQLLLLLLGLILEDLDGGLCWIEHVPGELRRLTFVLGLLTRLHRSDRSKLVEDNLLRAINSL